jgi:LmbE family N-acetylglucosaminyl deacetylase
MTKQLDILDLRHFTGSLRSYITETKPDMVIVLYNPNAIAAPDYATHTSMFDFR